MAKNKCIVYLGYEDEMVTDKNRSLIDYCTNKIGGQPVSINIFLCDAMVAVYIKAFFFLYFRGLAISRNFHTTMSIMWFETIIDSTNICSLR